MKLGFVSAILAEYSFEELIDTASRLGFKCVEVACWPRGESERRYAGVSHIDVQNLTEEDAEYIKEYCGDREIEISSLAYYPNTIGNNLEQRKKNVDHLLKVIEASAKLDINMVTTFIGRDQNKNVEENMELFKEVWPPIVSFAEEKGVKIAIEIVRCSLEKNNGLEDRIYSPLQKSGENSLGSSQARTSASI